MGIAGVMIEDQTFPKRCAYYDGLRVAPVEEMKIRIDSVLKARTDPNFFLLARTDAAADETQGMQEALRRARLYREWGADGVFISTPKSESDPDSDRPARISHGGVHHRGEPDGQLQRRGF